MPVPSLTSDELPEPLEYSAKDMRASRRGKGFLALSLTFFFPGLGHWAAGLPRRGVLWLVLLSVVQVAGLLCLVSPQALPAMFVMVPLGVAIYLACLVDGFRSGSGTAKPLLVRPWRRFAVGIAMIAVSVLVFNPWESLSFVAAHAVKDRIVEPLSLSGRSMEPTLKHGDRFIAHKKFSDLRRWDIVVVSPPHDVTARFALRIAGLPGEVIEVVPSGLKVDSEFVSVPNGVGPLVSMEYAGRDNGSLRGRPGAGCEGNPVHLEGDEYFLLGDNSTVSFDARLWELPYDGHQVGATPREYIIGKASAIYWPLTRWKLLNREH